MEAVLKSGMGMSLIRHGLTWGSGVLVAKGFISDDMATQMVSLAVGLIGITLSFQDKKTKQTAMVDLESSIGQMKHQQTKEQVDWQNLQQELSELRTKTKDTGRGPQARYEQVPVTKNSGFLISAASRKKMEGVNPLLADVVETAMGLSAVDFKVTEGVRSAERQAELLADKRSWVKVSKHQVDKETGLGHAVDVMALPTPAGSWDWEYYEQINDAMQAAAKLHNVRVTWGGVWAVRDGCHFQLDGECA